MGKSPAIALTVFALMIAAMFIYGFWQSFLFKREGVYVLGVVTHRDPSRKGTHYRGRYTFRGEEYSTEFTRDGLPFHVGSFFFVELAANHPGVSRPLALEPVPTCLAPARVPPDGWKVLPSYCHNPCGQPIQFSQLRKYPFSRDIRIVVQLLHVYSFHGGCSLRTDSLYANVFKCYDVQSRDTLLVFSPCTHPYDFVNVDYPPNDYVTITLNDLIREYPDHVLTALEDGDVSPNYQYIVADISHNLGID